MAGNNRKQATYERGARMLCTALGPAISNLLRDPSIVEVMLNPDGRIWIDRLSEGLEDSGERLTPEDGERIIELSGAGHWEPDRLLNDPIELEAQRTIIHRC